MNRQRKPRRQAFVLMGINAVCIALCWTSRFNFWLAVVGMSGLVFTSGFQLWSYHLSKRRYEQVVKEHLETGGTVMLAQHGRRWIALPLPRYVPNSTYGDNTDSS